MAKRDYYEVLGVSRTADEAGLKREHIHSSNYLETLDIIRDGVIGANVGFIVGALIAGLFLWFKPFGPDMPDFVYVILVAVVTLFGAWEGGLIGVANENQKLKRFQHHVDAGKYLILIYTRKEQEDTVKDMMRKNHHDAEHIATDKHFVNPFAVVRRRRARARTA